MMTKHRPPKLTLREIILGALAIGLASGILGTGLLLYLACYAGMTDVFSLGLPWVAAIAVGVGLVFLLFQYYGNRQFWR